LDTIIYFE